MLPEIKVENDYSKFKLASFNREIVKITVKKLKKEYEIEDNFKYFPILVDRNMVIIDGQHRYATCKELGLPIYYIKKDDICKPQDIRTVNKAGKKHSIGDVFDMELKMANEEALKTLEIGKVLENKFNLNALLALCFETTSGGQIRERLENGTYRVKSPEKSIKTGKAILRLTNNTAVSLTIYNALFTLSKIANVSLLDFAKELDRKGFVANSAMSKTAIINRALDAYNHCKKNKISIT